MKESVRTWLGAWALADQGVVSLGTFLTNIVLARGLPPSQYGVYGVYLAVFLSLNTVHSSLVTYPLSTSGAASFPQALKPAATGALCLTAGLSLPLLAALPLVGMATGSTGTLWLALAAVVCWQMQETVRRALMAGLRHSEAVWGDAISYLGQACLVWFLVRARFATLENIFAAMAVSSLAAALLQGLQLGLRRVALAEVWRLGCTSWSLGGWTLAANSASIVSSQMFIWAVAGFRGPSEAGAMLAVLNVLGVSHPLLFSLGNLIIPAASRGYRTEGAQAAWQTTWKHGRQGAALAAPYLVFLLILPGFALRLFYGGQSGYTELSTPVRWGAVAYAFLFASQVFGCYLGALQRVKRNLLVQILGAGASVLVGLPLAARFGVTGACVGLCSVNFTKVLAGGVCSDSLRHRREPHNRDPLPLGAASIPREV